jgi:hypothetical protein
MTPRDARWPGHGRRPWPSGLLLAYPPSWRARYGDELDILISDLRGGGRRTLPMALDLLRGAAVAWLSLKKGFAMSERSRAAQYTVLWSWVAFAATAAWFGHDLGKYPNRVVANLIDASQVGVPAAYDVLLAAGVVGVTATAVAALAFAVGAIRDARAHGRRRIYLVMAVPPVAAAIWLTGLQLIPAGSGSVAGRGIAMVWLLLGVAGIAVSTQAVLTIVRSCELDDRIWRIGGVMATVVTAAMLVATGATITWGLILHSGELHSGNEGEWLTVSVIMAVTAARAVIALVRPLRAGKPAIAARGPA